MSVVHLLGKGDKATGASRITVVRIEYGGVAEWSKGSDCKSDGSAFEGSNPSPSTIIQENPALCRVFAFLAHTVCHPLSDLTVAFAADSVHFITTFIRVFTSCLRSGTNMAMPPGSRCKP